MRNQFEACNLSDRSQINLNRIDPGVDAQTTTAAKPRCFGDIKVGQHYCDSDASIYRVFEVNQLGNNEVQIGIEPTWKNNRGRCWFTRDADERIPSSVNVYDPPATEIEASPSP